ncbi:hypothetical protein FJY69_05695 [candidate division WOR-3 bacterium]|nr:hypothetical protein [candidate division WOR-3 bacterium]
MARMLMPGYRGVLLSAVALLLSCRTGPNQAPVVESLTGPTHVSARDSAEYRVAARDPESGRLSFLWTATRGRLAADTGELVRWLSPDSADTAWLRVAVSDEGGLSSAESVRVIVLRDTTMFVSWWDGAVKAGRFMSWADTARAGQTLAGSARTRADTLGSTYLMVMDEPNFQHWVSGEPAQPLLRRIAYRADTFSVAVPVAGRYRVVIDNIENTTDFNYWIHVYRISR